MKILHVLSQLQPTGAETYAITLAEKQIQDGHSVFILSDKLHIPTTAVYVPQLIGNRKYKQRFKNITFIKKFIKEHKIDVIHAHSRAASWVCYFSLLNTKIPLISTIHGRQHLHASSKFYDIYGDRIITVCDNLKTHLVKELNLLAQKIKVIPNGIKFNKNNISPMVALKAKGPLLLIAGRTTGPKGERTAAIIKTVLPQVLAEFPNMQVRIIGGEPGYLGHETLAIADDLNKKYGNNISFIGFTDNLNSFIYNADLVIAAGRTAIEALWLEKPLLALGESCYNGLITIDNLQTAINSNFGDIIAQLPLPNVDYNEIRCDILNYFRQPNNSNPEIKAHIEDLYNASAVHIRVMEEYKSAILKKHYPKHIPVLMYHKIPNKPIDSQHRIFVTKAVFEQHLAFLHKNGFTPITFNEYHEYKQGTKPLSKFPKKPIFITFDDAYLDNLTNALPLLKKYNFKATIFALGEEKHTNNFWDVATGEQSEALLTTAQKQQMQTQGIDFGAHSMNHLDLTALPADKAFEEISESKNKLEAQLNTNVIAFAYPYGKVNEEVKKLTRKAGFDYAVAINSGGMHLEDDPLEIFRAYVFPEDNNYSLFKKTATWYRSYFKRKRKQ